MWSKATINLKVPQMLYFFAVIGVIAFLHLLFKLSWKGWTLIVLYPPSFYIAGLYVLEHLLDLVPPGMPLILTWFGVALVIDFFCFAVICEFVKFHRKLTARPAHSPDQPRMGSHIPQQPRLCFRDRLKLGLASVPRL
jgi:hypothetical protein